jgi:hypothetical protein
MAVAEYIISSEVVHCLNALGCVVKEQSITSIAADEPNVDFTLKPLFNF